MKNYFASVHGHASPFSPSIHHARRVGHKQWRNRALRRVSNSTPLDAPANTVSRATAVRNLTVPAVTTTRPGAMLIGAAALNSGNLSVLIAPPSGMNERRGLGGKRQEYGDAIQPPAGGSGDKTWTFSQPRESIAWLAALRPAP